MNQLEQLRRDLDFVRSVAVNADRHHSPATLYFLWAILVFCGFVLVDFRDAWVPLYWSIAAPLGFVASAYLGWRHSLRRGQVNGLAGGRQLLHWGGLMIALFLAVLMPMTGVLQWESLGLAILLILALGYFQAGVHLDRPFLWVGIVMATGYLFVMFVSAYAWTVLGVVLAIALSIAGLREGRHNETTA